MESKVAVFPAQCDHPPRWCEWSALYTHRDSAGRPRTHTLTFALSLCCVSALHLCNHPHDQCPERSHTAPSSTDALFGKHHLLVKREVLRKLVTTAGARAKPPYVIRPNMTRKRGNLQGGEGKDKWHLGNRQLGTHAVKTPESPHPPKKQPGRRGLCSVSDTGVDRGGWYQPTH